MIFEWTISIGNLLTVAGFGFSGIIFVMMMRADILLLGQRIANMEIVLEKLATASLVVARQEAQIGALENRLTLISQRLDTFMQRIDTH